MSEEEQELNERTIFWTLRNRILADVIKNFPNAWRDNSEYCLEISLLAAEGACAREASKVESGLQQTIRQLEAASKKIGAQMEQLRSNNIFAKTNGIDWDLLKDYFEMKGDVE